MNVKCACCGKSIDEPAKYITNNLESVCGLCIENALLSYPGNEQELLEVLEMSDIPIQHVRFWKNASVNLRMVV